MAGGTWTTQNKVRPGVYVNFASEKKAAGTIGERGIVTMALPLNWGQSGKVLEIHAGENTTSLLGYDITSEEMLLVREALKRAKTLLLYRLNEGVKASASLDALTVTARYGGIRGNDLSVVIQTHIDDSALFEVKTYLAGIEVDQQTAATVEELKSNDWVTFSGTGALQSTVGLPLTGGANGSVTNQNHLDYLSSVEVFDFHTLALPSDDAQLKSVYTAFVKRIREEEGRKIQAVIADYPAADYEGVISVKNGVILSNGTELNAAQATAWVAGATAGSQINQSLSYQAYEDAVDVSPRYTNKQIESALKSGEFVFTHNNGRAIVEQDINSLTSLTPDKGKPFSKNRVIRVLDGIANDFRRIFETFYIGKVDNSGDGRSLLRHECIRYLETLQAMQAIQNFDAQNDISVVQGQDSDSVYIETNIQPVDAIEKIYMKVMVK